VTVRAAELLEQAEALAAEATPGRWHEAGTLIGPDGQETDAATEGDENWVTFKTARADADRAFWIEAHALVPALAARLRDALTVVEAARDPFLVILESHPNYDPVANGEMYRAARRLRSALAVFDAGPAAISGRLILTAEQAGVLREFVESAAVFCDTLAIEDDTDAATLNLVADLAEVEALSLFDAGPAEETNRG
jgi:hypothetical protein